MEGHPFRVAGVDGYTREMRALTFLTTFLAASAAAGLAIAQRSDAFPASRDHAAIAYTKTPTNDPAGALNAKLESGGAKLTFEPGTGYLRAVLQALGVPVESQLLVFSQTSSQARLIDEARPRAIYFNDQVAVGWVRGGDVIEVAAQDPRQGTIFYTLAQTETPRPSLTRDNSCLSCHLSWDTRAVPGPMVLTTHARKSESEYANGGTVDDREPIMNRWGGWYVTGKQVPARHLGNRKMLRPDATDPQGTPAAPAYESLTGRIDVRPYLSPRSDVVALLVLEHQAHLANLLTRTGWEARLEAFTAPPASRATILSARVDEAVEELVDYMLFVDEVPLPSKVVGSSGFAEWFAAQGPRDAKGRSLRDFDLTDRMMRYPLSYMIYTPAFDGLPAAVRSAAYRRFWVVLSGQDTNSRYAHLTLQKRQAIVEILRATKPDLPDFFGTVTH